MLDLAKTIGTILDSEVCFNLHISQKMIRNKDNSDITYAKNVLNWEPQVNLQDGLKKRFVILKTCHDPSKSF